MRIMGWLIAQCHKIFKFSFQLIIGGEDVLSKRKESRYKKSPKEFLSIGKEYL